MLTPGTTADELEFLRVINVKGRLGSGQLSAELRWQSETKLIIGSISSLGRHFLRFASPREEIGNQVDTRVHRVACLFQQVSMRTVNHLEVEFLTSCVPSFVANHSAARLKACNVTIADQG